MNYLIKYVGSTCNPQPTQTFPPFKAGDTINVHVKIQECSKVRIQQFQGVVIQKKKQY